MEDYPLLPPPPRPSVILPKDKIDVAHVFLVYTAHLGDVAEVAAECQLPPATILSLATSEKWDDKLRQLITLSKSGKPGDWEKAHNRALNLVQCVRLRRIIDRMLRKCELMADDDLFVAGKSESADSRGNKTTITFSAKIPVDLSAALEKTQHLTYIALSDTLGERKELMTSDPARSDRNAADMHKALVELLNRSEIAADSAVGLLTDGGSALTSEGQKDVMERQAAHEQEHLARELSRRSDLVHTVQTLSSVPVKKIG